MPAALTVDQSLVDAYLARVDRFYDNVNRFEETLKEMTSSLKDRFMPTAPEKEAPVYQEVATAQPEQAVVTADDIDLDALLKGIDLGDGMSL